MCLIDNFIFNLTLYSMFYHSIIFNMLCAKNEGDSDGIKGACMYAPLIPLICTLDPMFAHLILVLVYPTKSCFVINSNILMLITKRK